MHWRIHLKKLIPLTLARKHLPAPAMKTLLTAHLSNPLLLPSPLLPISLTTTPTPLSKSVSFSIITTLEPYIPPKSKTTHQPSTLISPTSITQTVPSFSHPHPHPSITTNHLPLSSLFEPRQWNKHFHIPAHVSYSVNILQFQKCIQRQVGRVTFHTRSGRTPLVIVDSRIPSSSYAYPQRPWWETFPSVLWCPTEKSYRHHSHTTWNLPSKCQLAQPFFWSL